MKGLNVPLSYAVVGRLAALGGRRAAASATPLRHGCGLSVRRPAGMFCC